MSHHFFNGLWWHLFHIDASITLKLHGANPVHCMLQCTGGCIIHNRPTKGHSEYCEYNGICSKGKWGQRHRAKETSSCLWKLEIQYPVVRQACGATQQLHCETVTTETSSEVCSVEWSQYLTFFTSTNLGMVVYMEAIAQLSGSGPGFWQWPAWMNVCPISPVASGPQR